MSQQSASQFTQLTKGRIRYSIVGMLILMLLMSGVTSLLMAQEAPTEEEVQVEQSEETQAEQSEESAEDDEEEETATLVAGDTAWMLTATALVLFMTIPGLALFYGGLVRVQNVLSVLMQCFALTGIITVLWIVIGYSLAFNTAGMEAGKITLTRLSEDSARHF